MSENWKSACSILYYWFSKYTQIKNFYKFIFFTSYIFMILFYWIDSESRINCS